MLELTAYLFKQRTRVAPISSAIGGMIVHTISAGHGGVH